DAFHEQEPRAGRLHPQGFRAAIFLAVVPALRLVDARELDHDDARGLPVALQELAGASAYDVAAAVLLERGAHLLPVFLESRGLGARGSGEDVPGHALSPSVVALRAVGGLGPRRPRRDSKL